LPGGDTPPTFVARVSRLLAPSAPEAPSASGRAPAPLGERARNPRVRGPLNAAIWALTVVVVVAALGYYLFPWLSLRQRAPAAVGAVTPAPGAQAIPEKSIAVLPFVDMSEKHDQEYFSDGLAEELLDLLSQVPDLRVPA